MAISPRTDTFPLNQDWKIWKGELIKFWSIQSSDWNIVSPSLNTEEACWKYIKIVNIFLKNRNGRKRMFQMKETREVIILLYYTENVTLKQTLNRACRTAQRLASSARELTSIPWTPITLLTSLHFHKIINVHGGWAWCVGGTRTEQVTSPVHHALLHYPPSSHRCHWEKIVEIHWYNNLHFSEQVITYIRSKDTQTFLGKSVVRTHPLFKKSFSPFGDYIYGLTGCRTFK